MSEILYNQEVLYDFAQCLKKVDELMDSSCTKAVQLQAEIENGGWEGQAHDAMVAYMDLLVQFHQKFQGDDNPMKAAIQELDSVHNSLTDFYTDFHEYIDLLKV